MSHSKFLFAASLTLALSHATTYTLSNEYSGSNFFNQFDFFTEGDPTNGWVDYVSYDTALSNGLIKDGNVPTWGVDHTNVLDPSGVTLRSSIRLTSKASWTHGLFIADIAHMPDSTCGVWPAFWTLGNTGTWPYSGEIDIIEFVNNANNNLISAHTSDGCTIAGSNQTGVLQTNDCALSSGGSTGCSVSGNGANSAGNGFNANGGGVYAMEWTSAYIHIWFFPRGQIPSSITNGNPDVDTFGVPTANFAGSCDLDSHFFNHQLIFDTTFCGSWAGEVFQNNGCPMASGQASWPSCVTYVAQNPGAFVNSYWAVNSIKVYQAASGPVASSAPVSSVTPKASTAQVDLTTASVALGASTTSTSDAPLTSSTAPPPSTTTSSKYRMSTTYTHGSPNWRTHTKRAWRLE